jgi:mRNA interferase MazF
MRQGEIYWIRFRGKGSEPSGRRPAVVVQHDRFNRSAIQTTVVAAVTSNLMLAAMPGNVRLKRGEANLLRPSVINVTQVRTVDRESLTERIGALSPARVHQVLRGLALVFGWDALEEVE